MLISTETISLYRYKNGNIKEIIKLIKESGFDAFDFTMFGIETMDVFVDKNDYVKRAKDLRNFTDSLGIVCNQTHSFFPTIRLNNDEWNKIGMLYTKRSLEVAGILGAKYCVVHPCNDMNAEQNAKMYNELKQCALDNGVKIALENMWNWDENIGHAIPAACSNEIDFNKHLDVLNDENFVACLDIGHAEMKGLNTSAVQMIRSLNSRLKCLHIHDNDRHHDRHKLPYTYDIDFEPIIDALAEINYEGDITFEADSHVTGYPIALYGDAMKLMCSIGRYFKEEIIERKMRK